LVLPPAAILGQASVAESLMMLPPEGERSNVMETATECHQYAEECVRWTARAKTEEQRKGFLEIARAWSEAALQLKSNDLREKC
jgi:hypothetical protein